MHRTFPNVVPVANKYLGYKLFLKEQEEHENNIKNARGLVDRSEPAARPHCAQRLRQKAIKEHELAMIEQENERLRTRMIRNGSFVDTHNNFTLHSLNTEKRLREQAEHESEFHRLQKQISHVRPSYSARKYEQDYAKAQDVKKRMSKYSSADRETNKN